MAHRRKGLCNEYVGDPVAVVDRYLSIPAEYRNPAAYRDCFGLPQTVPTATRQPPPTEEPTPPRDAAAEAAALRERAKTDTSIW